jgi:hypothetical protein
MLLSSLGQLLVQTRSVNPYRLATQGCCNCIVHSCDTRLVLEAPSDSLYADGRLQAVSFTTKWSLLLSNAIGIVKLITLIL